MARAFGFRGPTARGHTSLGHRPRLSVSLIPGGLKARTMGEKVWSFVAGEVGATERGHCSPRLDSGLADRNVRPPLSCASEKVRPSALSRANGPGLYQPGPTAQVVRLNHFRRAEGPSYGSGMERPYRPGASRCSAPGCSLGPRRGRTGSVGVGVFEEVWAFGLRGPTARNHTSLGHRPRLPI